MSKIIIPIQCCSIQFKYNLYAPATAQTALIANKNGLLFFSIGLLCIKLLSCDWKDIGLCIFEDDCDFDLIFAAVLLLLRIGLD